MVRILDWACAGHDHGGAEVSTRDEIAFVRSGAFSKRIGQREIAADPSSAIFFPRGEEYRIDHHSACGDRCLILVVAPEELDEIAGRRDRRSGRVFPADRARLSPRGALLLRRLRASALDGDLLEVEEIGLELALEAIAGYERHESYGWCGTEGFRRREVERARVAMAARLGDPLSLADIARETAYSPWHLARVFRALTGSSLHQYLNRLRLLCALDLLEGGASLSAIAFEVGFSSHSHFSAAFRHEFGVPPSRLTKGDLAEE